MNVPHYDLALVCALAADESRVIFRTEFSEDVVSTLDDVDQGAARAFILRTIQNLSLVDFAETLTAKSPPADVFGVRDGRGRAWYVKIAIRSNGRLHVISFHPPERPMRTNGGSVSR